MARLDKGFNILEVASGVIPQGRIVQSVSTAWNFLWLRMMAELAPQDSTGSYQRPSYGFSGTIQGQLLLQSSSNYDAAKNLGATNVFPDEPHRYHLYVGNPCPWCHRTYLTVLLLGLEDRIGITRLEDNPLKASRGGWIFSTVEPDRIFGGCQDLRQLYDYLSPGYKGRCTAPLLVDSKTKRIVSNESSDIIRMLNFVTLGKSIEQCQQRLNLYPPDLAKQIDETNDWLYTLLNNGVYRCGFATSQAAYDRATADVRNGLARCEERLAQQAYLCSNDQLTEADIRLLPTALRFDGVYAPFFRAGGSHLNLQAHYPAIHKWLQRCWTTYPVVQQSIDLADACSSYYRQLFPLNPGGILPTPVSAQSIGLD